MSTTGGEESGAQEGRGKTRSENAVILPGEKRSLTQESISGEGKEKVQESYPSEGKFLYYLRKSPLFQRRKGGRRVSDSPSLGGRREALALIKKRKTDRRSKK